MYTKALIALLAAAVGVNAGATLALFQDANCQTPVEGTGQTYVSSGTCDSNVSTGYSSAKLISTDSPTTPAGTLTFYGNGICTTPDGSHGFSAGNFDCLVFGFVANSVGLVG